MDYKRILMAIDDSEDFEIVVDHAISIAKKFGSQLLAVTVFDIPDMYFINPESKQLNKIYLEEHIKKINKKLEKIHNIAQNHNIDIKTELIDEKLRPENAILYYAKDKKVDLIIIGNGKKGNIKKWILGSTASGIIRDSKCTVMLVR